MALRADQVERMNPWWADPEGWESVDSHLRALHLQPVRLPAPLVEEMDLDHPGLHTVRGPRQVGKSTDLKMLVRRALRSGRDPRQIIYLAMDALVGQPVSEVDATVAGARRQARTRPGALILLDEITTLPNWDVAVKVMWDTGLLRDDVVVCTGSSAYDLHRGAAERWPGRRGTGADHLVLP